MEVKEETVPWTIETDSDARVLETAMVDGMDTCVFITFVELTEAVS